MGGIISYPAQKQKRDSLPGPKPAYVKRMFGDDIEIETSKTYLLYLGAIDESSKSGHYPIIGGQGGMREVKSSDSQNEMRFDALNEIEVFNNYTNVWEALEETIPQE